MSSRLDLSPDILFTTFCAVIEIWGVATRLTKRLNTLGIHSILDMSRADSVMIRDRFSVVMMRAVLELQGTPCIPMEEERIGRDQLIFSRSFATPIKMAWTPCHLYVRLSDTVIPNPAGVRRCHLCDC